MRDKKVEPVDLSDQFHQEKCVANNTLLFINAPRTFARLEIIGRFVNRKTMPSVNSGPCCRVELEVSKTLCRQNYDVGEPKSNPVIFLYCVKNANRIVRASRVGDLIWFPEAIPSYWAAADVDEWRNGWKSSICFNLTALSTNRFGYTGAQAARDADEQEGYAAQKELEETTPW